MKNERSKIALLLNFSNDVSLATAKLLSGEGYTIAITGKNQDEVVSAVEVIGHGAFGLHNEKDDLGQMVRIYQKVICYFNGRIDLLVINSPTVPSEKLIEFTDAFFTVQYALPFLSPNAAVLFNSNSLTKSSLQQILLHPTNPLTGVKAFWGERALHDFAMSYN